MPLVIVAFTLFVILAAIALTPLALVQRYRLGTARRRARGWSATVNVAGLVFSSALFLAGAGITSLWVPNALPLTLMGFVSGCLLGLVGLALSRWEPAPGSLLTRRTVGWCSQSRWWYGQAGIWILAELACVAHHAGLWFVGGGVGRSGLTSGWRGRARVLPDILARRAPTSAVARREKGTRLLAIDRVGVETSVSLAKRLGRT